MLEAVEAVPWAPLEHAYGSAADVPDTLRAAAKGDAKALARLVGAVDHQGAPSHDVAIAVVPFLWEIASAGVLVAEVLVALGDLAAGGDHENFLGTSVREDAPNASFRARAAPRIARKSTR